MRRAALKAVAGCNPGNRPLRSRIASGLRSGRRRTRCTWSYHQPQRHADQQAAGQVVPAQRFTQQQGAPQHAEGRDQEGGGAGLDRPDIGQQAEVQDIGEGGADQAQAGQRQPYRGPAPTGGRLPGQAAGEQRQLEQAGTDQAGEGHQAVVQAQRADPAAGEETGEAVAGGGHQARGGAQQQRQVEVHRAGAGQHGHAEQAERHAGGLAGGQPLAEEQRADQYAHQRDMCGKSKIEKIV